MVHSRKSPRKSLRASKLQRQRRRLQRLRREELQGGFFGCNNYEAILKQSVLDRLMDAGMYNDPTFLEGAKRWTNEVLKEINARCKNMYCKREQVLEKIAEFSKVVSKWKSNGVINMDFSRSEDSHISRTGIKHQDDREVANPM